jgi:hypothetical protein
MIPKQLIQTLIDFYLTRVEIFIFIFIFVIHVVEINSQIVISSMTIVKKKKKKRVHFYSFFEKKEMKIYIRRVENHKKYRNMKM